MHQVKITVEGYHQGREERDEPSERYTLCLCHCSCHPANIQHSVSSVIWQTACVTYIYCKCFDNNASWGTLRDDYGACECFLHSNLYHMWLFVTGTLMQCFSLMLHANAHARADRTLGIVMQIYCSYTVCALLKQLFTLQQQMWWYTDLSYEERYFFISNLGWVGTLSSSFLWENNVFWFSLWYPLTALPQLKSFLSGDDNLCGSVGSECKMLGVQAGRDVIFDVLQNQLLNTLRQDWGECHREVIVSLSGHTDKTMHSWNGWKHSDVTMMSVKIAVSLLVWF